MTQYIPDDRALFAITEAVSGGRHIALFDALSDLVTAGELSFPREVVDDVRRRADTRSDERLVIWVTTVWPLVNGAVSYARKREAQGWAQRNGYEEGLDPALGGHESCIIAVVAHLFDLEARGMDFTVVTDDFRPGPGRAQLGGVCRLREYPTISPAGFVRDVLGVDLSAA